MFRLTDSSTETAKTSSGNGRLFFDSRRFKNLPAPTVRLISMSLIARDSFEFQKRSQLFIRMHNETLSVAAMRVSNPDRSPFTIMAAFPGRVFGKRDRHARGPRAGRA